MSKTAIRLAGVSAILSALMVPAAIGVNYLVGEWAWLDFFLFLAPAALAPALLVLEPLYKPRFPRWSSFVTRVGLVGLIAFGAMLILMPQQWWRNDVHIHSGYFVTLTLLFVLVGVWMILTNLTSLKAHTLPIALGVLGLIAGAAWTVLLAFSVADSFVSLQGGPQPGLLVVLSVLPPIWLVTHIGYAAWLGLWLLTRGGRRVHEARAVAA